MSARIWSFVLGWSRVGLNAALFLAATRVLTLAEIGLFATAYAPIRLTQGMFKAGVSDAVIVLGRRPRRWDALFALSLSAGGVLTVLYLLIGAAFSPILLTLGVIPLINSIGAVSEGILRQRLALRALALRTAGTLTVAAIVALWMLATGWGLWALVAFSLLNAVLTCVLSFRLAAWRPQSWPAWRRQQAILPKTSEIAGRVLITTAQMPLAQLAFGLALGPIAAGAFQIASRMLDLIDALTLSPLRFVALPQFNRAHALRPAIRAHLRVSSLSGAWVWAGTFAAAPEILAVAVGPTHATTAAPILRALAGAGLLNVVFMPILQALTARGLTRLVLKRAALLLGLSAALVLPALTLSTVAAAIALSLAVFVANFWLLGMALPALGVTRDDLNTVTGPLCAGAIMGIALVLMPALSLLIQIVIGTALYVLLLGLTRLPRLRMRV